MRLKKTGNIIGSAQKKKNLFVLDFENNADKIMIAQGRGWPIYLLNKDPEVRLCHCRFTHASNALIIQTFKLVDRIKLSDTATNNSNDDQFSLDSEADNGEKSEPDIDMHITPTPALLNKIMESIEDLCDTCIESKHTRIIKDKAMTLTVRKL